MLVYVNDGCTGSSVNEFLQVYLKLLIGYKCKNNKNYNESLRTTKGREIYNVDLRILNRNREFRERERER